MDNQHRKIEGYRELTQEEIDHMNAVKIAGKSLGSLVEMVDEIPGVDHRWVAVGKTHLQQGLMALTRAITKPEFF